MPGPSRRHRPRGAALALLLLSCACEPAAAVADAPERAARSVRYDDAEVFVPPGPQARQAAIGPLDHLAPELRAAFVETAQFRPLQPPEPGDWLYRVRERGQTFEAYARSDANQPAKPGEGRDTIYILPIGSFPDGFIVEEERVVLVRSPAPEVLEDYAERFFAMPVSVLDPLPADEFEVRRRIRHGRDQLYAPELLERLVPRVPADGFALIALTNDDLFAEDAQEFSFGYASLTGRVGVYSFARYDPQFNGEARGAFFLDLILRRSLKIMAHELGHMFGLEHCVHYACVMNGAADLVETDRAPPFLCPVCMRKLQFATGFDPVPRYRALVEFYEERELDDEQRWLAGRLAFITGEY
ncbi:MAG: hypothetical protein H6713_14930 [Myxococcales bacterium]|nr:hypothetical protein [Myxococcales bacterium]